MKKSILLIGYNYSPEPTGIGKYSGEMIEWLAANGHECTVITTYPYYPFWKVQEPYRKSRYWFKTENESFTSGGSIKVIRCPIYVPAVPSGLKRIILDFTFLFSSAFPLFFLLFKRKKDLVMAVAPSFLVGFPAVIYKLFKRSKFDYHIQDMQIEAARDLGMIKSEMLIRSLFKVEAFIINRADVVSSISDGMISKLKGKCNREIYFFPNWADVKNFLPIDNKESIKKEFGFKPEDKVLIYSGAIGQKQGLEAILKAANYFKTRKEVKFIICGSGPYKATLETMSQTQGLTNVDFLPLQPLEKFNSFLNLAQVHLVIQKADASDLMMPSKLTAILAVGGLALITANKGAGLHTLVSNQGVGIVVDAENQDALNKGIESCLLNSPAHDKIRKDARQYAEKYLDKDQIMRRFVSDLL